MKPYDELTKRGKLRRLRSLSLKALEDYDALCGAFSEGYTSLRQWLFTAFGQQELRNSLRP
jgi:hypothetical protein